MAFSFFHYASTLGVHTSLLLFTVLFLPRTSLLYYASPSQFPFAQSASSRDRPQPPFLEPLTASPTLTLGWICVGVCILVVWWAGWVRSWAYDEHISGLERNQFEAKTEYIKWRGRGALELKNSALATLVASVFYHVVVVLFGAPISSHHLQTYLLALELSLLTVLPSAYVLGTPSLPLFSKSTSGSFMLRLTWTRIFAELAPKNAIETATLYPVVGTMLGCWCGCIPIGLDWDRPWQAWPLTPAYGSVIGYVIGSLSAFVTNSVFSLAQQDVPGQTTAAKPPTKAGPRKGKIKAS